MDESLTNDFLADVERAAALLDTTPSSLIQAAANRSGQDWLKWSSRDSSPTLKTADRIRNHIAEVLPGFSFDGFSPKCEAAE